MAAGPLDEDKMVILISMIEVSTALGILVALSGFLTPPIMKIVKRYKKCKAEQKRRNDIIDSLPCTLEKIERRLITNETYLASTKKQFDKFEVHQLKYIINDALFGYETVDEIPQEVLVNASECCDSYLSKGLNHEIGARCKIIYKEIERRELEKSQQKEKKECDVDEHE